MEGRREGALALSREPWEVQHRGGAPSWVGRICTEVEHKHDIQSPASDTCPSGRGREWGRWLVPPGQGRAGVVLGGDGEPMNLTG